MGGCVAILSSYYFNIDCITFGTPPFCRQKFTTLYNKHLSHNKKCCINFRNLYDPIPSIYNSKTLMFAIANLFNVFEYKIYRNVKLPGIYININLKKIKYENNYIIINHLMANYLKILSNKLYFKKIIETNKKIKIFQNTI